MDSEWWLDCEPYPGPHTQPPLFDNDTFKRFMETIKQSTVGQRQMGKSFHQLAAAFLGCQPVHVVRDELTVDEARRRALENRQNRNIGPTPRSVYDHTGRRK